MQGVNVIADNNMGRRQSSVIDDALLVSRPGRESQRKLQSLSDESDLAAGRSRDQREFIESSSDTRNKQPLFDAYTNATSEAGEESYNSIPASPSGWRRRAAGPPPAQSSGASSGASSSSAAGASSSSAAAASVLKVSLGNAKSSSSPRPRRSSKEDAPLVTTATHTGNDSWTDLTGSGSAVFFASADSVGGGSVGGGSSAGGSTAGTAARALSYPPGAAPGTSLSGSSGGTLPVAVSRDSSSGARKSGGSAGKLGGSAMENETHEKKLLAQIKELTRQLDKEKFRKKEHARTLANTDQRRRLVICTQVRAS